jgi:predicted nucleic acid-binding Zn ribbon protein
VKSFGAANDRDPVPLGESLDGVVRSLQGGVRNDAGAAQAMGGVFGRWEVIVGEAVAAHVQPIRLDGRRLIVEVSDPAWATQMRLLTDQVRQRIREVTGTAVDVVEVRVASRRRR